MLKERNDYRQAVRFLQRHPDCAEQIGLPYGVPAPISPGTVVRAYNSKSHIVERGVVMNFDQTKAMYLIQFENSDLDRHFCADSEVATVGGPKLLIEVNRLSNRKAGEGVWEEGTSLALLGKTNAIFLRRIVGLVVCLVLSYTVVVTVIICLRNGNREVFVSDNGTPEVNPI